MSTLVVACLRASLVVLVSRARIQEKSAGDKGDGALLLAVIQQSLSAHQGRLLGLVCPHCLMLVSQSSEPFAGCNAFVSASPAACK